MPDSRKGSTVSRVRSDEALSTTTTSKPPLGRCWSSALWMAVPSHSDRLCVQIRTEISGEAPAALGAPGWDGRGPLTASGPSPGGPCRASRPGFA
jgi:hypothetical protein